MSLPADLKARQPAAQPRRWQQRELKARPQRQGLRVMAPAF
jgi:hypothetical protein